MTRLRVAVRVVLLDPSSRVLLFEGRDLADESDTVRYWFTVGGAVEEGESFAAAAKRELREETGWSGLALAGPLGRGEFDYLDHGVPTHQVEHFYAARTRQVDLDDAGWTDHERAMTTAWRWWSRDELAATDAQIYPEDLADLMTRADGLV